MSPTTSTRWCPTAEQLMILEEMYKGGIRTPNASQIQQITAHLSFYGKIEGKNVFYWFQNHKARDRQKLRRKLTRQQQQQQHQQHHHHLLNHQHHIHDYQTAGASSSSAGSVLQQFPLHQYNSPQFLLHPHQEGVLLQEEPSHPLMNCTSWKEEDMVLKSTRMHAGCADWMMDMVPPTNFPYCTSTTNTTRPALKTLELFPVKSTNLKDECTTSKHFSCSTNSTTTK